MAITASFADATIDHARHIDAHARPDDRRELDAAYGRTPFQAIMKSKELSSFSQTGLADGVPAIIWGVSRGGVIPNYGIPWLVCSDLLDRDDVAIRFLRMCREPLVAFLAEYDILLNYVDVRNTRAIRWLKFMGFTVEEDNPQPYGVKQLPFYRFKMVRENV